MDTFIEGLFLGVVLALMIGPVFFILLQTSIQKGASLGLSVAFGESASDMLFLLVYYIGFSQIALNDSFNKIIGFFGVLILLAIGVLMLVKAKKKWDSSLQEKLEISRLSLFFKGFLINSFNPFVYVFWAGVMGVLKSKYEALQDHIIIFCIGIFVAKFIADILKVLMAGKIKKLIHNSILKYISELTGIILIIYAIVLFCRLLLYQ